MQISSCLLSVSRSLPHCSSSAAAQAVIPQLELATNLRRSFHNPNYLPILYDLHISIQISHVRTVTPLKHSVLNMKALVVAFAVDVNFNLRDCFSSSAAAAQAVSPQNKMLF